jgi:glycosyltransferase involved in cell wall biosynthesis
VHILVSEMSLSGHHANYLDHIAQMFLSQGHRVTASVRETEVGHPVLVQLRQQHPDGFRVAPLPPPERVDRWLSTLGVVGGELAAWRAFRRFFKGLQKRDPVDRVFYPYLDYCLHATALLGAPSGETRWAGICMRPSFHLRRSGVIAPEPSFARAKERLFHRLLAAKGLNALFTIDELLCRDTRTTCPGRASRLHHIADPSSLSATMDRDSARSRMGLAPDEFVVLVYGAIDDRKGVQLLLEGLRNQRFSRPVRILVVGKHTAALRQALAQEPQVTTMDGYADSATEEAAFRSADLVWLGYRSHYAMSGVLVLAAIAGVPVLATHEGLIGWMAREHDLGDVLNVERATDVAQCLARRASAAPSRPTPGMDFVSGRHTWHEALSRIHEGLGLQVASRP